MQCPRCQQENRPGAKFCDDCGAAVNRAVTSAGPYADLKTENEGLRRSLGDALEQQTATAEILRVISSSPTDVQPVFDTIVSSAVRLCDGLFGALYRFDGELLHLVAHYNYTPEALEAAHRVFPGRPSRGRGPGRAILDRAVAHIPDVQLDLEHRYPAVARGRVAERSLRSNVAGGRSHRRHRGDARRAQSHSPTARSSCSGLSPTRPSSSSRTCGSSPNSRRATAN
jgi:hypothetical protein